MARMHASKLTELKPLRVEARGTPQKDMPDPRPCAAHARTHHTAGQSSRTEFKTDERCLQPNICLVATAHHLIARQGKELCDRPFNRPFAPTSKAMDIEPPRTP